MNCTHTDLVVLDAPDRFHLEIRHYRARQWIGTTFTRNGFSLTSLPLPPRAASEVDGGATLGQ